MRHPDAKAFFCNPITSSSSMSASPTPSLKIDRAIATTPLTAARPEAGDGAGTLVLSTIVSNKRTREPLSSGAVSNQTNQCNTAPNLVRSESSSNAKRPRVLVQFKLQPFEEILEECQGDREEANRQYRMHLDLAARREAAYNQQAKTASGGGAMFGAKSSGSKRTAQSSAEVNDQPPKRKFEQAPSSKCSSADSENNPESESDSESSSTAGGDAAEASESEPKEDNDGLLQWLKPGQLSRQVGISISVLRRWANTGLVQTLVSEGGHRLFNVASVTDYIAQQLAKTSVTAAECQAAANDTCESAAAVFVRLPTVKKASTLLSDQKASSPMQDAAKHVQQQIRSAFPSSKIIIELPEIPLADFQQRNSLDRLHAYLRKQQVSKLILRTTRDISDDSVAYALFEWVCARHDVAIEIIPNLYTLS